jgi:Tat protein translocase TatB subunit
MDFFGIGGWEILLILIVALIIMGPGKIPEIARTMGRTVRAIRKASAELTTAVTRELDAVEKSEKSAAALKADSAVKDSPTKPGKAPPSP